MAPVFCKDCSTKIGIFKKKHTCQMCLNRFCDKCFSKVKENAAEFSINRVGMSGQNCLACIVLQGGPIRREQLFLLRNKQLAIYLNERNISTENCSEKYHLVDLIMEFAETHGLKSGDDLESDVIHRDHVEELKRQAELLQVQEHINEQSVPENDPEQPHFSGNEQRSSRVVDTESVDTESVDTIPPLEDTTNDDTFYPSYTNRNESEDSNSGASHQDTETNPAPPNNPPLSPRHQASGKWYSVEDIEMEEDISCLSVLELKQILAANFIDYRGCCEKKELQNKVTMLYQSQQAEKTDDDKPDRDLCKICMDRTIDCVFLDCAHLVACTKCGKQLSECPICRAFIVRVVHIFRA